MEIAFSDFHFFIRFGTVTLSDRLTYIYEDFYLYAGEIVFIIKKVTILSEMDGTVSLVQWIIK